MRRAFALVMALGLVVGLTAPAAATTVKTPFSCEWHLVTLTNPGEITVEDGAIHMRGFSAVYDVVGDEECAGTMTAGANFNLDLATWLGVVWGTGTLDLDAVDGGYTASMVAHFTANNPLAPDATDIWAGRYVRHGFGAREGWQARGSLVETTHASLFETGFAFSPGE